MKVGKKNFSTLWMDNGKIKIIDQTKLPFKFVVRELNLISEFCAAIRKMQVRGAPLIGVTAAFGFATEIMRKPKDLDVELAYSELLKTRPTAINLRWALDLIKKIVFKLKPSERGKVAIQIAKKIREDDIASCEKIGENGYYIIEKIFKKKKRPINILTHCNAGWLATVDWGTALSPIYKAKKNKIPIHIWVDETRPRNQGALLTAWELNHEKIPYTIIVDNAGGHLMQRGEVDLCIVGSDRTTSNGDVCNKIGTYLKAISAYENNIPFYVALPTSTIDLNLKDGKNIPIENRNVDELSHFNFLKKNKIEKVNTYFNGANMINPAFDVTPSRYITRLITENGVCMPNKNSIMKMIKKNDKRY